MSLPHRVAPPANRPANASAGVRVASIGQFQDGPIAVQRRLPQIRAQFDDAWQLIGLWRRRRRDRAILRSLSAREIRDFCPRQAEAEEEMSKPFWRG